MRPELESTDCVFIEPTLINEAVIKSIIARCHPKCKRQAEFNGFKVALIRHEDTQLHSHFSFLSLDSGVYALGKTLGRGGFGKVRLALNLKTGEQVAIKSQKTSKRHEVQKQTMLTRAFGIGRAGEVCGPFYDEAISYIVLPLATESLRDYYNRGRYTLKQVYTILHDIMVQLQELHYSGRVHLDIRPDNILMFGDNAYIADFGLCMTTGTRLYGLHEPPLKYKWAPPERFFMERYEVHPSTDMYGLGYIVSWFTPKLRDRALSVIQAKLLNYDPRTRGTLEEVKYILELAMAELTAPKTCVCRGVKLASHRVVSPADMPFSAPLPLPVKVDDDEAPIREVKSEEFGNLELVPHDDPVSEHDSGPHESPKFSKPLVPPASYIGLDLCDE